MRNKMIELIREVQYLGGLEEKLADHLIANGVTIQRWIPVKEALPEEECEILVTDGRITGGVDFFPLGTKSKPFGESLRLVCSYDDGTTMYPTHWMPLPEPPKGE